MSFAPVSTLKLRQGLFVLALWGHCAWSPAEAYAQEEVGKLTVEVWVRNRKSQPIPNAEIQISRRGMIKSGKVMPDIVGVTDADGKFTRQNADLQLVGDSHRLTVTAPGFGHGKRQVTDEMLHESVNRGKKLVIELELDEATTPDNGAPSGGDTKPPPDTSASTAGNQPVAESPTRLSDIGGDMNPGSSMTWVLGALSLLILLTGISVCLSLYRLKLSRAGAHANDFVVVHLSGINKTLESLKHEHAASLAQQKEFMAQIVKNNEILLRGVTIISIHEESSPSASHTRLAGEAAPEDGSYQVKEASAYPLSDAARQAYISLINKRPTVPDPIYLDVEGARSIASAVEGATVYLAPVSHSQAAFVLFTESNDSGWVFPNPTINFRPTAVRDVFPSLTESQFGDKENIRWKRVERVGEKRWRVT